jgi:prolyl oligopeptidase
MTFDYPETRRDDTVETLHGVRIEDPYRWLEDPDSDETRAWVKSQNEVSRGHLDALASRPWFHEQLTAYVRRPRAGTPDKLGGRYVVTRNDGSLEQDQLYVADTLDELRAAGRILLDPNEFSDDGTSSLFDRTASKDGTLLAYLVSDGGSDWTSIRLLRLDGSEPERPFETLTNVKFSSATWLPDHSFLYLHYDVTGTGTGTDAAALPGGKLKLHRVGTPQSDDALILEFPDDPRISVTPELSHDGRYVVVTIHEGTSEKNRLWVYPVETTGGRSSLGRPLKVVDETYAVFDFVRVDGDRLYLRTDHEAPLGRVVVVDLDAFPRHGLELEEVVAESESALWTAQGAGEEILTIHLVDAQPRITRHALDGSGGTVVPVEGGTVVTVNAEAGDPEVFIGTASVSSPLTPYRLDLSDGSVEEIVGLERGRSTWTAPEVVTERRRAPSLDGTEIPYFLFRRRDLDLDTPRPTLLYGYGGFNVPILNHFRPTFSAWLAAGGVLAVANLRGGSEYGAEWHDAGRLREKQNVFDDFAGIADHLVEQGVTTREQLALHGGSNGGLLVGAVITQRPDLAAVALPSVGVMDMLRFHLFTIGAAWIADYGSPEDPEEFAVLRDYSPLHNIEDGTAYPATLVLTGDHDDRVVPAHSFKFTAALQRAQAGDAPVMARIETSTGHALGKPARVIANETADLLAFAAEHTGLTPAG